MEGLRGVESYCSDGCRSRLPGTQPRFEIPAHGLDCLVVGARYPFYGFSVLGDFLIANEGGSPGWKGTATGGIYAFTNVNPARSCAKSDLATSDIVAAAMSRIDAMPSRLSSVSNITGW